MLNAIKKIVMVMLFYLFRMFPIQQNKIVFSMFSGKGFGDNGKYIANELLKRADSKFDLVWLCNDNNYIFPEGIRKVKRLSVKSIYEQSTARIWIDNRRKPSYVRKRKGQFYIQTWHAMDALKKVERDAEDVLSSSYISAAKRDSQMADLFLAGSEFDAELYRHSFWYNGEIMKCGCPRDDILFQDNEKLKFQIKEELGFQREEKIVLYAPTFRAGENESALDLYNINWDQLLDALSKRFGGDWAGMIRLHPNISQYWTSLQTNEKVYNATNYPDMQELLLISDCVITDYSSAILEHAMTGKVGFIYAVDIDEYSKDRGSYFSYDELPFPVAQSNKELIANILAFDHNKYQKENSEFYNYKYGLYIGGNASEILADMICKIVSD